MYTYEPGTVSQHYMGLNKPYKRVTRSWRVLTPDGRLVAETTAKWGAVALCGLLNRL